MHPLAETFASPDSRVSKTIVVVDLKGSTSMKEDQPEAQWLPTYGFFFDMLERTIAACNGRIVKYVGDGAMAVFSEDQPADAINWGIMIQEAMGEARDKNRVSCDCSIGISYGEVAQFPLGVPTPDYIGSVVDKAFRLSNAANAKAIFVDVDTIAAAPMHKVKSQVGYHKSPRRKSSEYTGPVELVTLKGFHRPVAYHEILWDDRDRYGVLPDFVTKMSQQVAEPSVPAMTHPQPGSALAAGWTKGRVAMRNEKFGFIKVAQGDDHFFNADYLFRRDMDPRIGDDVWFIPAAPLGGSPKPRALDVLPFGVRLGATIDKVKLGFAFATATGQQGDARQMFVFTGTDPGPWFPGQPIEFTVGENPKGLAGLEPRVLRENG